MSITHKTGAFILGIFVFLGLSTLGYLLGNAAIEFKQFDRSVTVKGLSEREYPADIVIWPIQFTAAGNDLESLYNAIELNTKKILNFLGNNGINTDEITLSSPVITDKSAQQYGNNERTRKETVDNITLENVRRSKPEPVIYGATTDSSQALFFYVLLHTTHQTTYSCGNICWQEN